MAKREFLDSDFVCACGHTGSLRYSENENPIRAGGAFDKEIEYLSPGFKAKKLDSVASGLPPITCGKCGQPVQWWQRP